MRNFILLAGVVVLAAMGWFLLGRQGEEVSGRAATDAPAVPQTAARPDPRPETETETAPEAAELATETEADTGAEADTGIAVDVQTELEQAITDVGDAVTTTLGEASTAVEGALGDVSEAAGSALEGAADAIDDPTVDLNAAADTLEEAGDAVGEDVAALDGGAAEEAVVPAIEDLLTVEGFDAEAIRDYIERSETDPFKKQVLEAFVSQAEENPELVGSIVTRLRETLGL